MEAAHSYSDSRLPTNVKPMHYDLTVRTDLQEFVFEGLVKVRYVNLFSIYPIC